MSIYFHLLINLLAAGASSSGGGVEGEGEGEGEVVGEEGKDMIKGDQKDNSKYDDSKSWQSATENCRVLSGSFESDKKRRRDSHG